MRELYEKLSNELHHDGLIHKDELAWALFKAHKDNLFVDRVFELFDMKRNNVIEFGEFVRSLSVFHPDAPLEEKANCKFLKETTYIYFIQTYAVWRISQQAKVINQTAIRDKFGLQVS